MSDTHYSACCHCTRPSPSDRASCAIQDRELVGLDLAFVIDSQGVTVLVLTAHVKGPDSSLSPVSCHNARKEKIVHTGFCFDENSDTGYCFFF